MHRPAYLLLAACCSLLAARCSLLAACCLPLTTYLPLTPHPYPLPLTPYHAPPQVHGPSPQERRYHTAVVIDKRIFIFGGQYYDPQARRES